MSINRQAPALRRLCAGLAVLVAAIATALMLAPHALAAAPRTINVSPTAGRDTASGSALHPLKTLAAALAKARAGDTIRLGPGIYSAPTNGERFSSSNNIPTVAVPAGVTIQGATGLVPTILSGDPQHIGLILRGGATVTNVETQQFKVGVEATQGNQTLAAVDFDHDELGLLLNGNANTTFDAHIDPTAPLSGGVFISPLFSAVSVNGNARFTMNGGKVLNLAPDGQAHSTCRAGAGIIVNADNNVTVRNAQFVDLQVALDAAASSVSTIDHTSITAQYDPGQCESFPALKTLGSASLTVTNSTLVSNGVGTVADADGIDSLSDQRLIVSGSEIRGFNGAGIRALPTAGPVEVFNSSIDLDRSGIDTQESHALTLVNGSSIDNNVNGILAPTLQMRTTDVSHNSGTGIVAVGGLTDLGSAGSTGLNTITDNVVTGVRFGPSVGRGTIFAVGDVWDPGEQGANGFGFYNDPLTIAGGSRAAIGRNFILDAPSEQIELGPVSIGRPRLTPAVVQGRAGDVARLALSWTHPVSWQQLAQIQLRLRDGSKQIGSVTIDPRHDVLSGRGPVALIDRASGIQRGGKTVTASLAIRLPHTLAGRSVTLDVVAADRGSHVQTDPGVGAIDVQ